MLLHALKRKQKNQTNKESVLVAWPGDASSKTAQVVALEQLLTEEESLALPIAATTSSINSQGFKKYLRVLWK